MKPSLQLRLGQQLKMTPQLQQAIRLLQLSTVDLKLEIQEALESNLMLEVDEDTGKEPENSPKNDDLENPGETAVEVGARNEQEIDPGADAIPSELTIDSSWEDHFDITHNHRATKIGKESSDWQERQSSDQTLREHLYWQLDMATLNETDRAIGTIIIDGISADGYLTVKIEDIVTDLDDQEIEQEEVLAVLHRIQQFDPAGIAARSVQESLCLQLGQLDPSTPHLEQALFILNDNFDLFIEGKVERICRILKIEPPEYQEITSLIKSMDPHPGSRIAPQDTIYVEPDVVVVKEKGLWKVLLNRDIAPKLRINSLYATLVKRTDSSTDNLTMKNHLQEARWFIKSLQSRNETLLKVAREIVNAQSEFFEFGEESMKPLVLREIAEKLEMHESTISRVTTQKYMRTPRGTLEFKYFFSSHVGADDGSGTSSTAIRALIKKLVAAEPPNKPLSDNKIAGLLSADGIKVARRTIAKYRELMAIPPSNERKRLV
jgi:RNA polymerase sigma-54 factor